MLPAIYGGNLLDNAMFCVIRHQLTPVLMRSSLTRVFSSVEHEPLFDNVQSVLRCHPVHPHRENELSYVLGDLITDRLAVRQAPVENRTHKKRTFVFIVDTQQLFMVHKPPNTMFLCANHDSLLIRGPNPALHITDGMQKLTSKDCTRFSSPSVTGTSDAGNVSDA